VNPDGAGVILAAPGDSLRDFAMSLRVDPPV
jgi:hypothetical protein